jgi:hypothetical protein
MQDPDMARANPALTSLGDGPVVVPGGPLSYIHWGPVVAGAVVAAATSFVLLTFASAIGLAVASPSPTWRDTSVGLVILSGVWVLVVAVGSFALGGYLAGRVRSSWSTTTDEIEFRDGVHGLLVWGLGVVIAALLAWGSVTAISAANTANSSGQRTQTREPSFLAFELDRLFRSDRRPEAVDPDARAEAGRILLTGVGRRDVAADDRTYLARLVVGRTGIGPADADRRVSQILEESRRAAAQARASGVIAAFTSAAALALAAVAAWLAAGIGGHHRDNAISPPLRWQWRQPFARSRS